LIVTDHERSTVEHELVLSADLIDVDEGNPVSRARSVASDRRWPTLPRSNGEPLGTIKTSALCFARCAATVGNHMSSQISTPSRMPRKSTGAGSGPAAKTRFSSNTP
jgi:hypothetical protein